MGKADGFQAGYTFSLPETVVLLHFRFDSVGLDGNIYSLTCIQCPLSVGFSISPVIATCLQQGISSLIVETWETAEL